MIPADWTALRLGEVAEFINGRGFKPHEWSENGLPIIRIQNLNGNSDFNYYSGTYDPKIEVRNGDLLFAWSGSRGSSFGPHFWFGPKAVLNYHTWRVVVADQVVDKVFMFFALQHLTAQIEDEAHGAAGLVHTQKNVIELYRFFFPSLPEQRAIATVLSTWDRSIRQLEDLTSIKLRFKQGLMQQLLTGKLRFPKFSTPWTQLTIGDIACEVSERQVNQPESIPVLSCTKHDGLVNSLEYFGRQVFSEDRGNYKIVRQNEFAYATNHIEEGSIGLLSHAEAGLVSPMYTVFRTNDKVNPKFLYRVLKTEMLRRVFASFTSASVNRRGSLRWKQFSTIALQLPSLEEQYAINELFEVIDREIGLLQKQLELLKLQKKGLMQKLLTGQVRVKLPKGAK